MVADVRRRLVLVRPRWGYAAARHDLRVADTTPSLERRRAASEHALALLEHADADTARRIAATEAPVRRLRLEIRRYVWLPRVIDLLLTMGRYDDAEQLVSVLEARAAQTESEGPEGISRSAGRTLDGDLRLHYHLLTGRLAVARDDVDAAAAQLEAAARALPDSDVADSRPELTYLPLTLAQALLDRHRPAPVLTFLDAGIATGVHDAALWSTWREAIDRGDRIQLQRPS